MSSPLEGEVDRGEDVSVRSGRRKRPRPLMADIGPGRFNICSRPVPPVFGGGNGVNRFFVCVVGAFACVPWDVIPDEFEISEALFSALNATSAASRSAFCCRRILSTNGE